MQPVMQPAMQPVMQPQVQVQYVEVPGPVQYVEGPVQYVEKEVRGKTKTVIKEVEVEVPAEKSYCDECEYIKEDDEDCKVCELQNEIDALRKAAKKKSAKPAPAPKPVEKVIQPPKCKKCNNVMDAKIGCQVCPLLERLNAKPEEIPVPPGVSMMLSKEKQVKGVKVMQVFTGASPGVLVDNSKGPDIRVNDNLIAVNGTNVEEMELENILKLMLNTKKVKVNLTRMVGGKLQDVAQEFDRWDQVKHEGGPAEVNTSPKP